jgi:hypothetical protein
MKVIGEMRMNVNKMIKTLNSRIQRLKQPDAFGNNLTSATKFSTPSVPK